MADYLSREYVSATIDADKSRDTWQHDNVLLLHELRDARSRD